MRSITKTLAVALLAGAAFPALAQDSVSTNPGGGNGLPGDALSPYDASQTRAYVVDLAELVTSKGTRFGIAPIIKTSKSSSMFFNNLSSAQAVSPDLLTGVPYPSSTYEGWGSPGFGVHRTNNMMGSIINANGNSNQLAATIVEFATNDGGFNHSGVVSSIINYNPADPSRLYVKRVQAAVCGTSNASADTASLGGISIDANANNYFRADGFGAAGGPPVSGNNLFRVNVDLRSNTAINQISGGATFDATDGIVVGDTANTYVAPNCIAQSTFGAPGAVSTGSFANAWVRGAGPVISDTTQLVGGSTRGEVGGSPKTPLASGVWTCSQLNVDGAFPTNVLDVWSASAALGVVEKHSFAPPAIVTDPCDAYPLSTVLGTFDHYHDQVAFRGGVGQVAVGADGQGRGLVAATFDEFTAGNNSPFNHILVARFNEDASSVQWTLAAWTDVNNNGGGKPLCDETGAAVGRLTYLQNIPGAPSGPSISCPAIDGAGNVWFLSAVELYNRIDTNGDTIPDASDFDTALVRAIYDATNFCYRLELVLELGQVVHGVNSDTDWQVQFLEIADSNSISSGGFYSSNVRGTCWDNAPASGLDPADPKTNGGVVVAAKIVYDVDGDGDFDDPTSGGGDPASEDEGYHALLFVGQAPAPANPGCNAADLAIPYGTLDFSDVIAFLTAFGTMDPAADLAPPMGVFDFSDVIAFLTAFGEGCP
ncbi:MAG: GC-type dockerin domain-anchored protein [Phycisphaerales bacterium]